MDAVYDITYAYEGDKVPGITDVAFRRLPNTHYYIRRYSIDQIPKSDEELKNWCIKMWYEKDELLEGFYKTGTFPRPLGNDEWSNPYVHEYMHLE